MTATACLVLSVGLMQAQEGVLSDLYGNGVHAYFAGQYRQAYDYLTSAIDAGTQDPRVYYYRGLTYQRLGRPTEAQHDFLAGARLETGDSAGLYQVDRSLQRIQGRTRLALERVRSAARAEAVQHANAERVERYQRTQAAQEEVLVPPSSAPGTLPPQIDTQPLTPPADPVPPADAVPPARTAPPAGAAFEERPDPFGENAPVRPATPPPATPATPPPATPATPPPATPPAAQPATPPAGAPATPPPATPPADPFATPPAATPPAATPPAATPPAATPPAATPPAATPPAGSSGGSANVDAIQEGSGSGSVGAFARALGRAIEGLTPNVEVPAGLPGVAPNAAQAGNQPAPPGNQPAPPGNQPAPVEDPFKP
jgi:hypothetical protein